MTTHAKTDLLPVLSHKADAWSTGTEVGAEIDTQGFTHALVLLNAGTATGTLDLAVTESAAAGGSKAAANDDAGSPIAFAQVGSSNDDQIYAGLLRLDRRLRYLQLSAVIATDAVDFGATVILLNADHSQRATAGYSLAFEV